MVGVREQRRREGGREDRKAEEKREKGSAAKENITRARIPPKKYMKRNKR